MNSEKLKLLIAEGEGLAVEFKEKYTPKIDRDIVAFANTKGGCIILGVTDSGRIVGEKLTNKMRAEIHSIARNCEPPVAISKISQIGNVAVIDVAPGDEKPYSCSSGYFRRLDAVTQKMSHKELKLLFQKTAATPFEERINKDATWDNIAKDKIRAFFKEAKVSYSKIEPKSVLGSLNLSRRDEIKNAGVLFFANEPRKLILQCEMTLVAFKGTNRVHIYDRKDVQDDLLTQFNEAILFLKKHLNIRSEIKGVTREDIYEIPLEALREGVANSIIHRDYSMRGTSIMVEVHADKVVISNPGGLPEGLSPRSLLNVSVRRNELIADMFARMDKVERMGTGIRRMRDAMKNAGLAYPKMESNLFFMITFMRPKSTLVETEKVVRKGGQKVTEKQALILKLIKKNPAISRKELSEKLRINESAVQKHLSHLKENGLLKRVGPDKGGHWEVTTG